MNRDEYYHNLCPVNQKAFLIFERHAQYANTFIETGCHEENTCVKAYHAGYNKVYSCDIDRGFVEATQEKISNLDARDVEFRITHESSEEFLSSILPELEEKAVFWLDAHDTFGRGRALPTYKELQLINKLCVVRENIIIVDDIQLFFKDRIQDLQNAILEINPDYKFKFETIHNSGSDHVLVAYT